MKIQELAEKTGLSVHTVRYYEKEGLLDNRHVLRDKNNYRNYIYSDEALGRLKLIKKFQGVGCSLIELMEILQDHDTNTRTNQQVIEWISLKINEIERKKDEYDQMLATLNLMLEYRIALQTDPKCHQPLYLTVNSEPPLTVVFCFRHRHLCRRSNNVAMVDGNKKMPASKNRLKISALLGTWLSGVTKISFHQTSRTIPYRVLNWTG